MRRVIKEHNVYRWAADIVHELSEVRIEEPAAEHAGVGWVQGLSSVQRFG
jgi:hypothetical protein